MKKFRNRWIWGLMLMILMGTGGCNSDRPQKINRRVTLWKKDKIPYGTYIAYENLKYIFPNSEITVNNDPPTEFSGGEGKKAYIIIVPGMRPDVEEMNAILNFVGQGNTVFISAFQFGDSLLHTLHIKVTDRYYSNAQVSSYINQMDSLQVSVKGAVSSDSLSFFYPGDAYDNHATSIDSQYTTVLGKDRMGRPNFVKFGYKGGGALYLHFAPMAFTNFFLLYKENKAYYDNVLSYIPQSVSEVKWDEYFRYDRRRGFSAFQYILNSVNGQQQHSFRWAFWLLLLLFLIIYLFESKRRQRIVPIISGLRNNSLDFVRTIGRLYYQRRDNHNLAMKMVAHFQDHVRTRYNLPVPAANGGDEEFLKRLSYKSGYGKDQLGDLMGDMRRFQDVSSLSDEELLAFNRKLDEFYKHA